MKPIKIQNVGVCCLPQTEIKINLTGVLKHYSEIVPFVRVFSYVVMTSLSVVIFMNDSLTLKNDSS